MDSVKIERDKNPSEMTEILERIPDSVLRKSILLLILIFTALVMLGYMISYPDVLIGKATLSSSNSAINLVMPTSGKIELNVRPKDNITMNQVLGIVNNPALTSDMYLIKKICKDYIYLNDSIAYDLNMRLPQNLKLGEVSISYLKFRTALKDYIYDINRNIYEQGINNKRNIIEALNDNLEQIQKVANSSREKLYTAESALKRDSALLMKGIISQSDFEITKANYLQQKISTMDYNMQYLNTIISIKNSQNEISQFNIQKENSISDSYSNLIDCYAALVAQVDSWEKKYVISSPIEGIVEYLQFWKNMEYIAEREEVFCVIPNNNITQVQALIAADGIGKIRIGQKAIIKLADYPYTEYGTLNGHVINISSSKTITKNERNIEEYTSLVTVELENENRTNYGTLVELKAGMPATIEIMTAKKRLIHRVFEKVKYIINKE